MQFDSCWFETLAKRLVEVRTPAALFPNLLLLELSFVAVGPIFFRTNSPPRHRHDRDRQFNLLRPRRRQLS